MTSDTAKNTMNQIIIINKAIHNDALNNWEKRGKAALGASRNAGQEKAPKLLKTGQFKLVPAKPPQFTQSTEIVKPGTGSLKSRIHNKNQKLITQDQYLYPLYFKILRKQSETKQC